MTTLFLTHTRIKQCARAAAIMTVKPSACADDGSPRPPRGARTHGPRSKKSRGHRAELNIVRESLRILARVPRNSDLTGRDDAYRFITTNPDFPHLLPTQSSRVNLSTQRVQKKKPVGHLFIPPPPVFMPPVRKRKRAGATLSNVSNVNVRHFITLFLTTFYRHVHPSVVIDFIDFSQHIFMYLKRSMPQRGFSFLSLSRPVISSDDNISSSFKREK